MTQEGSQVIDLMAVLVESLKSIPHVLSGQGWTMRRVQTKSGFSSFEVFTDPNGVEWIRAGSPETTELLYQSPTRGVPPLKLKRRSRPFGSPARERSSDASETSVPAPDAEPAGHPGPDA